MKKDNFGWDADLDARLRSLAAKRMFATEIAKEIGKKPASVSWRMRKLGLVSTRFTNDGRFGKWNAKHAYLREAVLVYFQTHTWAETAKKFGLADRELKSLFTASYRMKEFAHIRKDKRLHSAWSTKQLKFLLQHAGLRPRKWIMAQLGRGNNVCHIKERMQALGISSRTLQGITLSQFRQAFDKEPDFFLQTDAGPNGGLKTAMPTRWKIVPWVWLDQELKARRLKTAKEFAIVVSARATFQEWIFEGNALKKMKKIVKDAP
jgi:hypothetical protein